MAPTTEIESSLIPASSSRAIPRSGAVSAAGCVQRAACRVLMAALNWRDGSSALGTSVNSRGRLISTATVPALPKPDGHSRPLGEEEAQGIPAARDRAGAIPPFRIGASVRLDAGGNPIKIVIRRIRSRRSLAAVTRSGPSFPLVAPVRRPDARPPARSFSPLDGAEDSRDRDPRGIIGRMPDLSC